MAKVHKLTHERLLEALDLDPATGIFVWKIPRSNRVKVGSRAGVFHHASGGRYISIDNEKFMAHRLAFFYVTKRWPNTDVRPLDGDYDNCAITNLQEIERVFLAHQRAKVKNNTSGYAGVSRSKRGKWQAKITWNYQQVNLGGSFETAEDASEMYEEAERRLKLSEGGDDHVRILDELRIWRGQKTAWRFLQRSNSDHAWPSFESFCESLTAIPNMRYALVPIDAAKPMGPDNFRWAFPARTDKKSHNAARRANRHHQRDKELRKLFGINTADYQRMLADQNEVCAICEKPETKLQNGVVRTLSVDHNHATGAIRGLLCANCNMGLGYFCDDPQLMRSAIVYLAKHSAKVEPPFCDWLEAATGLRMQ